MIYVDGGDLLLISRPYLEIGVRKIHSHFTKIILEMKNDRGNKTYKTEYILFLTPWMI